LTSAKSHGLQLLRRARPPRLEGVLDAGANVALVIEDRGDENSEAFLAVGISATVQLQSLLMSAGWPVKFYRAVDGLA
jgi:hypothetical protein